MTEPRVSIQPLYRFKKTPAQFVEAFGGFQYNPCIGSRFVYLYIRLPILRFNTTLVSVQEAGIVKDDSFYSSFNTTLVSVQATLEAWVADGKKSFNTTLVSVQVNALVCATPQTSVSIQPLYRFKCRSPRQNSGGQYVSIQPLYRFKINFMNRGDNNTSFNTTLVSVQENENRRVDKEKSRFQYNPCIGSSRRARR